MTGWPAAPAIYEIDTWPWLTGLTRRFGRPVTLGDVPAEVWDEVAAPGMDAVWLMGVWERSPAGLAVARVNDGLQRAFRQALPDLAPEDVVGSPYCVRRYRADDRLGGPAGLAAARAELNRRGLKLVLDYVPNHVAPDHPAVVRHPDWFIRGSEDDLAADPTGWFHAGGRVIAHGRDPYFPPWPDVAQLNAFAPGMRAATLAVMSQIAEQCDGMRCDMAMLLTNDIFAGTWGRWAGPRPDDEFWPALIGELRRRHPEVVLIAEVYWETEWLLQQQGFDFCYDKRLYDRLAHEDAGSVRRHLAAGLGYQERLIRFLENHDEPRAAATLPGGRNRAAAVAMATLPGATLWHDGQFDGRRAHLPVFLARYRDEHLDPGLRDFHRRLVRLAPAVRRGRWRLLGTSGWADNESHQDLLAWAWEAALVVVNYSGRPAQGRVELPWPSLAGRAWRLVDRLDGRVFERSGSELAAEGLYVDLPAWGFHVLTLS
ncbi:alpha-amylase [Actinoplanes sp. SE50]|uniref:alpha-amylase family glycosyl hydrolase n=1 Tax=unclassified Actinoplanes TaxID=2626549 RepID=UPI00023EBEB4|nr:MULTISPECIES: alpha-amylase family glycosyl hydrolase [unclassified Actinoplanes]AEV82930.1 1,4-alpha-glucan-branching enzyme [Actinoplanes sp. SE50/110]ATO81326.1 alpha-amylase [Actinoplanes sp. SE50]SLL98733.1 alpha-amylase [Actinoplanes sp. SE50/110]